MRHLLHALALFSALGATAVAGPPSPSAARLEIGHLLAYLETSQCRFNRNGSWYEGERAAEHLGRKHAYYLRRDDTPTAEEFISTMASASSMSGKPYLVRCGAAPDQPSGDWFRAELARYRAAAALAGAR